MSSNEKRAWAIVTRMLPARAPDSARFSLAGSRLIVAGLNRTRLEQVIKTVENSGRSNAVCILEQTRAAQAA